MTEINQTPSLEAIAHQVDDKLFRALTEAFENYSSDRQLAKMIPEIISEHTGITTEFSIIEDLDIDAAVMPPQLDKNHAFYDELERSWRTSSDAAKLFRTEKTKVLTGSVDRANSRVSGAFTKIVCPIYITTGFLRGKFEIPGYSKNGGLVGFTAQESAAAILHEIGHIFSYFESLGEAVTTNWILEAANQAFFSTTDSNIRVQIVRDMADALDINLNGVVNDINKIETSETLVVLVLAECEKASKSKTGATIYDLRSWESASDQFASRHGASLALATGLDKMAILYGDDNRQSKIAHWVMQIVETIQRLLFTGLFIAWGVVVPIFAPFALIYVILMVISAFLNPYDDIYDPHKFRIGRIRQDIISRLKMKGLPPEYVKRTVAEFDRLEQILKDVKDHETLWRKIWTFCSPFTRRQKAKMSQQQELELLANNELYITAARLRILT